MKLPRIPFGLGAVVVSLQLLSLHLALGAQRETSPTDGELVPGWIYDLQGQEGKTVRGVSANPNWAPGGQSIDSRIAAGPYRIRWSGLMRSEGSGEYQFACYVQGRIALKINGVTVIEGESPQPVWLRSDLCELSPDFHKVTCEWSSQEDQGELSLYWKGPRFDWERLPESHLFHVAEEAAAEGANHADWQAGRTLVDSLRCAGCHAGSMVTRPLPAPELTHVAKTLQPEWIFRRLRGMDSEDPANGHRSMPEYELSREDAMALTSYLLQSSVDPAKPSAEQEPRSSRDRDSEESRDPIAAGRLLVVTLGCLACHEYDRLGTQGPYAGGDLSRVADKRPADFFSHWLRDPTSLNRFHRMPRFVLSDQEVDSIARFLATCRVQDENDADQAESEFAFVEDLVPRGRELYDALRCANCHESDRHFDSISIEDVSRFRTTCGGKPSPDRKSPGYRLDEQQRHQIETFLNDRPVVEPNNVELNLARNNCSSCHKRGTSHGIAEVATTVFKRFPSLAKDASALRPPALDRIGDKLFRDSMEQTIREGGNRRRPWLQVRMPVYPFDDLQRGELVSQLIDEDRMPAGLMPPHEALPADLIAVAGPRLITSTGFGCSSCHTIGSIQPPPGPLNARGPSLSMIGEQVREDWFRRWVANPARFEPDMEMPSIQISVDGVLNGNLNHQLSAVWQTLNQPGFEPPLPDPVRVVRHSGLQPSAQAHVLTDVIRWRRQTYVQPFAIGFGNRHNVLLDLETGRLAHWWAGDVMRQHTEGKTWFWEPGGTALWNGSNKSSDWVLVRDGETFSPVLQGQFVSELDAWEHVREGVKVSYRLSFAEEPKTVRDGQIRQLQFIEIYHPVHDEETKGSGWLREVTVEGLEPNESLRFVGLVPADAEMRSHATLNTQRSMIELAQPQPVRFEIESPSQARFDESLAIDLKRSLNDGTVRLALLATTLAEIDAVHLPPRPRRQRERVSQAVVPGFDGWELPIYADWMPTALAWDPQGRLYVSSLKGRIWRVLDQDNDGWEDEAVVFSDELAAPFGLTAHNSGVDVINKYALLRLIDVDGDGHVDVTRRLASGWGHTADYHDWSVGLPRDKEGNYYIATACQQDDRTEAAAHWRGKVLKLLPQSDGTYEVKELSAGHRFPIGIALREDGELFVTDNQGNYNPFNELNHVIAGARYGFINRLEQGNLSSDEPRSPAIKIPHPWTRSVNGICFLDGSADGHPTTERRFGPYTGHLVGCEYDTRRLVRMSLQEVDGQFQGAVYPFSLTPQENEPSLLGPLACAVAPNGDLYVGNIRDSGWGGANNIGGLVRLRFRPDSLPCGIAEVEAISDGFRIEFTRPVSIQKAMDVSRYQVNSYRRIATPAYGGPDVDRRRESDFKISVDQSGAAVELRFAELREGFVYEFSLESLVDESETFFPAEAFYSLNRIPQHHEE